jgi:hypothetical protein
MRHITTATRILSVPGLPRADKVVKEMARMTQETNGFRMKDRSHSGLPEVVRYVCSQFEVEFDQTLKPVKSNEKGKSRLKINTHLSYTFWIATE